MKDNKLNISFFIATRVAFNSQKTLSRFIIRLSVTATAISVAAMIIAVCFVTGFQETVSKKVFSFWGHIRVQHFSMGKSLIAEEAPIIKNDTVEKIILKEPQVTSISAFATKSGVLQFNQEIEGVLLKGITKTYDSVQFQPFIKQGRWLHFTDSVYSKEIIIPTTIANTLQLHINDNVKIYFILNGQSTYRKLTVVGIYKTGIEEYDNTFAIADLKLIQRVSNWQENEIGGYEIMLRDYLQIDSISNNIYSQLPEVWESRSIKEVYPNIFDWLNILDTNRNVVFIIMGIVAIINLVTCLLILVLERTNMIGILKALGMENKKIQSLFIYYAGVIALRGVGIGLFIGVLICLLQKYIGIIHLDEANYYVSVAPVSMQWLAILGIVIATSLVCFIALLLPSFFIKKIAPVKAIAFR
jgi:lipoprotein-releasing system permease protein